MGCCARKSTAALSRSQTQAARAPVSYVSVRPPDLLDDGENEERQQMGDTGQASDLGVEAPSIAAKQTLH